MLARSSFLLQYMIQVITHNLRCDLWCKLCLMSSLACLPFASPSTGLLTTCLIGILSLFTEGAHRCPLNGPPSTFLIHTMGKW
ncbi:hypothetical protein EUGRSUZ_G02681 [Eucalyptus grandis]|uniref:Uncharacterized protein n=2 Tax=Eucalyptus grandis TaxID=71139 RepID=A0ACC3K7U6_EUCGR|nr:hypothetical protein EUGRSUZ_G02681 [Eucalyptus grandis]